MANKCCCNNLGCAFERHWNTLLLELYPKRSFQAPDLYETVFPSFSASFQPGIDEHCYVITDGWNRTVRGIIFRHSFSMLVLTFRESNSILTFMLVYIPCNPFSIATHIYRAPSENPTTTYDRLLINQH